MPKVDPQDVVNAARENGEPDLAEWIQREADDYVMEKRLSNIKVACWLTAFWGAFGWAVYWIWFA